MQVNHIDNTTLAVDALQSLTGALLVIDAVSTLFTKGSLAVALSQMLQLGPP